MIKGKGEEIETEWEKELQWKKCVMASREEVMGERKQKVKKNKTDWKWKMTINKSIKLDTQKKIIKIEFYSPAWGQKG